MHPMANPRGLEAPRDELLGPRLVHGTRRAVVYGLLNPSDTGATLDTPARVSARKEAAVVIEGPRIDAEKRLQYPGSRGNGKPSDRLGPRAWQLE